MRFGQLVGSGFSFPNFDVGEGEIGTLREQRFARGFRQRIRETICGIQRGRMAAFSVLAPCGTSKVSLLGVYGYDFKIGADDEEIKLAACRFSLPAFENNASFEHCRGRYKATSGGSYGFKKTLAFG